MHPEQIKAAIRMSGTTAAVLADELGVSRSAFAIVIHGRGTSARIKARIAKAIDKPVEVIWPPKATPVLRRASPAKAANSVAA